MLTSDDAEPRDMLAVVEDVEPLGAGVRRQAGDDVDLPETSNGHLAALQAAVFDEVLVDLGCVESADDGPDSVHGRVDSLSQDRVALAQRHMVRVVGVDDRLQGLEFLWGET